MGRILGTRKTFSCNSVQEAFQAMKSRGFQPRSLYPAELSFRMEGRVKCFPEKVKLKEFIITKPSVYEMLKGLT